MKPLIIFGNGEIACIAYEYFTCDSQYEVVAFSVDTKYISEKTMFGLPVVSIDEIQEKFPPDTYDAFVAIGDIQLNRARRRVVNHARELGYNLTSFISSKALVWRGVTIGPNCFIFEGNVIQPFVTIGENVTLWSGNHIGHRSTIEDDVFISSHVVVSGFCNIGRRSFIGVNAAIGHGVKVAEDNFIGMSASLSNNTEPDRIYQGNPAEPRKISATRFCRVQK